MDFVFGYLGQSWYPASSQWSGLNLLQWHHGRHPSQSYFAEERPVTYSYSHKEEKNKGSCSRWFGPHKVLISTSWNQSWITWRDIKIHTKKNWGNFSSVTKYGLLLFTHLCMKFINKSKLYFWKHLKKWTIIKKYITEFSLQFSLKEHHTLFYP